MDDSTHDKLQNEYQLLSGLGRGIAHGAREAVSSYGLPVAIIASGFLGYGLGALTKVGAFGLGALGTAMNGAAALDAAGWAFRAGGAAIDTWRNPSHLQQNVKMAEGLGTEAFESGAMFAAGYGGLRLAGWKTPLDFRANIRNAFDNITPGYVPRLQTGDWLGLKPTFESANTPIGKFYSEHSPAVGQILGENWHGTAFYAGVKDNAGYWLTNWHNVHGAEAITIKNGGLSLKGTLLAADPVSDVAVVATDAVPNLKPVRLADAASSPASERALAISHARGSAISMISEANLKKFAVPDVLDGVYTTGAGRPIFKESASDMYIKRDFADERLAPGASGSPWFSEKSGDVIGMVSHKYSKGGLALDVEHLKPVLEVAMADPSLIGTGKVLQVSTRVQAPKVTLDTVLSKPVTEMNRTTISEADVLNATVPNEIESRTGVRGPLGAATIAGSLDFIHQGNIANREADAMREKQLKSHSFDPRG